MARILLFFYGGNDAGLIECPQHIADNLKKYQRHFDKWIYDIKNQHIFHKHLDDNYIHIYNVIVFFKFIQEERFKMKKILILVLVTVMVFSMVACGSEANESGKISSEGTVNSQPVGEANEGGETSSESTVNSQPVGEANESGETSSESIVDSQPVDGVEQSFDFKTLSSYGMPEPSFGYSYKFYEETMLGMRDDGEPNLLPKFTFEMNTDRVGAHEYMGQVKDSGWGGDIPYLTQEAGGAFWYVAENENYKINITWDDDTNTGEITITDKTKCCVWDNTKSFYIIDDMNEYDSYAPYRHAQSN